MLYMTKFIDLEIVPKIKRITVETEDGDKFQADFEIIKQEMEQLIGPRIPTVLVTVSFWAPASELGLGLDIPEVVDGR